jgi:hypothetical protein
MSHDALAKSDMTERMCRLTHACGATCIDDEIAPPARLGRHELRSMSLDPRGHLEIHGSVERHARLPMSLHATAECDMSAWASRCAGEGQATFTILQRLRRARAATAKRSWTSCGACRRSSTRRRVRDDLPVQGGRRRRQRRRRERLTSCYEASMYRKCVGAWRGERDSRCARRAT